MGMWHKGIPDRGKRSKKIIGALKYMTQSGNLEQSRVCREYASVQRCSQLTWRQNLGASNPSHDHCNIFFLNVTVTHYEVSVICHDLLGRSRHPSVLSTQCLLFFSFLITVLLLSWEILQSDVTQFWWNLLYTGLQGQFMALAGSIRALYLPVTMTGSGMARDPVRASKTQMWAFA